MLTIWRKENIVQKHKWYNEIVAWASGAEIECRFADPEEEDKWQVIHDPCWYDEEFEFRIKPTPKEPQYLYVYKEAPSDAFGAKQQVFITTDIGLYFGCEPIGKIKLEVDDD